jgi:hypothetical protein
MCFAGSTHPTIYTLYIRLYFHNVITYWDDYDAVVLAVNDMGFFKYGGIRLACSALQKHVKANRNLLEKYSRPLSLQTPQAVS